jgi:diadenosine tetraphosphate (Ap4A) HIT family hydrolase
MDATCEFCRGPGGEILWQDDFCRVVDAAEPDYPGFLRVILQRHARELTDLAQGERARLMEVVFAVEETVRSAMRPDKVNVASLGNMTPHVHWHVIPRFEGDRHFPGPVWAQPRREPQVPGARREDARRLAASLPGRLARPRPA